MHFLHTDVTQWIARVFLVVLFPFSAFDKIAHWDEALKQAQSSFLPGGKILLLLAIALEFLTPLFILIQWHDRAAAFVLAAFCIVTAFLYHPFWNYSNFWRRQAEGRAHFWDFLKNFGLAGGLLLLAMGVGRF
jgi:putative oxidoreductase